MIQKLIIITLLSLSHCALVLAEEPELTADDEADIQKAIDEYEERPWELGVAAGYGVKTNPLVNSDDIPMYAVLNIAWFGDYFFFDNGDVGLNIYESEKLSLNLISHINNEREIFEWLNNAQLGISFSTSSGGVEPSNTLDQNQRSETSASPRPRPSTNINFDELGSEETTLKTVAPTKRSLAVDGGFELLYEDDWGDIQLQVMGDMTHTHKGWEVWASYAYPWKSGNWRLTPSFGLNWKSSHLLDYYYGVRASEPVSKRPAYQAHSGFNSFVKLSISYRINDNWGIVGIAEYESLSRSIRHSPIVDQDGIETLFIGLMYNF
jgi:outer membrane protein